MSILLLAMTTSVAHSQEVIDRANFRASYQFLSKTVADLDDFDKEDLIFVDIGSEITKSYSRLHFLRDSLTRDGWKRELPFDDLRSIRRQNRTVAPIGYYHRFADRKSMVIGEFGTTHGLMYEDQIVMPLWSITAGEQIEVSGYKSIKATANYLGREWTVYFSPEIPISQGPWRLWGLPGLIVKAYDSENLFLFELTGFEEVQSVPIIKTTATNRGEEYQMLSKAEFVRLKRINYDSPTLYFELMHAPYTPGRLSRQYNAPPFNHIPLEPWD